MKKEVIELEAVWYGGGYHYRLLDDKKGFLQPEHKRQSMIRNINNIFHRINLSEQEIRILLGIFTTLNDLNNKS